MPDIERDSYLPPPSRFGGVPTGAVTGSGTVTYDELLREHLARRFGELPSLAPHEVMAMLYPSPWGASAGGGGLAFSGEIVPCGLPMLNEGKLQPMPLTAEQEAYIARVRSEVRGEWAVIRERETSERGRLANIAVSEIRARGPILIEGEAIAGEYDDAFTIGGERLDDMLFDAVVEDRQVSVTSPGRVRVTIEFLDEVTDA